MASELRFVTALTVDECLERLSRLGSGPPLHDLFNPALPARAYATLRGRKIRLRGEVGPEQRGQMFPRNSFRRFFDARLVEVPGGTEIVGRFRLHPLTRAVMTIWFGGVLVIGGMAFATSLRVALAGSEPAQKALPGVIVPPAMLAFGWALIRVGIADSAPLDAVVLTYLRDELRASRAG